MQATGDVASRDEQDLTDCSTPVSASELHVDDSVETCVYESVVEVNDAMVDSVSDPQVDDTDKVWQESLVEGDEARSWSRTGESSRH